MTPVSGVGGNRSTPKAKVSGTFDAAKVPDTIKHPTRLPPKAAPESLIPDPSY